MAGFTLETRTGGQIEIVGKDGVSLMKLIRRAGVEELTAQCGGGCACASCHVYVTWPKGVAAAKTELGEARMLSTANHRRISSRLACQIKFEANLDGMRVCIAPEDMDRF
ncbi:2Fe-2S iron-sulfur cluster-binding protein [Methylocapsa palsarum]|uniref:Ferredoxin, 2Fe-2S n=1 Tax=Methylocapsa palsarum TaxID=1612308 RepID=A0A1I4ARK1_9HYPH|nr:2Fe-2S iron-sulfur cluster-binding protein [Methylocapsa palsarum]SFK58587.1 ferredoxin, 2Fe-2S [Methylocapsa palsarum]